MITVMHESHRIEVKGWGKEIVYYDGQPVSAKWSMVGSTHVFRVKEEDKDVQYEVTLDTRWHGFSYWCEIRRNGQIIYTDR